MQLLVGPLDKVHDYLLVSNGYDFIIQFYGTHSIVQLDKKSLDIVLNKKKRKQLPWIAEPYCSFFKGDYI